MDSNDIENDKVTMGQMNQHRDAERCSVIDVTLDRDRTKFHQKVKVTHPAHIRHDIATVLYY
jgi:hypothetical protein